LKENVYLLVHGFNGSPDELEYLNNYLKNKGLDTRTVLLAGHGSNKKALQKSSHTSWIGSVETVLSELAQEYKHITLIGFSMGGLICVNLASQPAIDKIVLINTPIYFWNFKIILSDIAKGIYSRKFEKIAYYKKSVFGVPAKSGIDFLWILAKAKQRLKDIKKPALILQCKNDESVHFKSAKYIKNKIGGFAELRYYNGGSHQVFDSVKLRDLACEDTYVFISK